MVEHLTNEQLDAAAGKLCELRGYSPGQLLCDHEGKPVGLAYAIAMREMEQFHKMMVAYRSVARDVDAG